MTKPVELKHINYNDLSPTAQVVFASAVRKRLNEKFKGVTYKHLIAWAAYRGILDLPQSQLSNPDIVLAGDATHMQLTGYVDYRIWLKAPAIFLNTDKQITLNHAIEDCIAFLFDICEDEMEVSLDDIIYFFTANSYHRMSLGSIWFDILKEPLPEVIKFPDIRSPLMPWPTLPFASLQSKYVPNKLLPILRNLDVLENLEAIKSMGNVGVTVVNVSAEKLKANLDALSDGHSKVS